MNLALELPALREELVVREGPRLHDGQPSWTLHDPARNRFFRLDWLTFEIMQRWSLGQPASIARAIGDQTPLAPTSDDVLAVLKFAGTNQLLKLAAGASAAALAAQQRQSRPAWWLWLVHNYLFFRVPLVRPEHLLKRISAAAGFLFRPLFWRMTALAAAIGFILLYRQWDTFAASWADLANVHGLLGFLVVLIGVKIVHELGHGLVATHFGCRVPAMGVAFLVMTPVAYTDTNEAWNLTARRPRLLIGAAGMLAELCVAAWSTLAWCFLPDGYLRSAALLLATITWIKSLLINTSPVMRFDGYYLLSDYLDLPNLHSRAFALARWWLREKLFALGEPPPEHFRSPLRRGLIAFAIFVWLYRLVVFVGIAVFVYHFFFKALGVVLFAVEIAWFVALPVLSELKVWRQKRGAIVRSPRFRPLLLGTLAVLAVLCFPLPQRVRLSVEFHPQQEFRIVAPENARLLGFAARDGERVPLDTEILALASETLQHKHRRAKIREEALRATLASTAAAETLRSRGPVQQAELGAALAEIAEIEVALAQLRPRAPFPGIFRAAPAGDLNTGDWVARHEHLGTLIGDAPWLAVGYLDERFRHLVTDGATARFFPDGVLSPPVAMKLVSIEADASRSLAHPMLAASAGGSVPARLMDQDLVPDRAVYRLTLAVGSTPPELLTSIRRGRVVIDAGSESLASRFGRQAASLLWRELGF